MRALAAFLFFGVGISPSSLWGEEALVDVLVVYTNAFEMGHGGPEGVEALARSAIFSANESFAKSDCGLRIGLVGVRKVDYRENTYDMEVDLDHLTEADGVMDEVHQWRDAYGADLVCLFREDHYRVDSIGIAWLLDSVEGNASKGFSVVAADYALSSLVFQHEIGHNLGASHDRQNASTGLFEYSYGYRFFVLGDGQYRTVMAYDPGTRINQFSNPAVTFEGVATGVGEDELASADNAKALRQTSQSVSNYRVHKTVPPDAEAGESVVVEDDDNDGLARVLLDGSQSYDLGGIVSWKWTWQGGEAFGESAVGDFAEGEHLVTLRVTDVEGASATDTMRVTVLPFSGITGVFADSRRVFYLKESGIAYASGSNLKGMLGLGSDATRVFEFSKVGIENIDTISMGGDHVLFLRKDGSVFAAGNNDSGQFGKLEDGRESASSQPMRILEGGVKAVAAGVRFSIFVKEDGSVWSSGFAAYGSLGIGELGGNHPLTMAVERGGSKVAAGLWFGLLLKDDGSLWASGSILNDMDRDVSNEGFFVKVVEDGVSDIAAGDEHAIVLMKDGSVWTFGKSTEALGIVDGVSEGGLYRIVESGAKRVFAGDYCSYVEFEDGSFWGAGVDLIDRSIRRYSADRLTEMFPGRIGFFAGGSNVSIIVRTDGSLWVGGSNDEGQLGLEGSRRFNPLTQLTPTAYELPNQSPIASIYYGPAGVAMDEDGDGFARLHLDASSSSDDWLLSQFEWVVEGQRYSGETVEVMVPVGEAQVRLEVTDDEGRVDDSEESVTVKPYSVAASLHRGYAQCYVIREDGSLWGFGTSRGSVWGSTRDHIAADTWRLLLGGSSRAATGGVSHTVVLKEDGSLWGLGSNAFGQLGLGDLSASSYFKKIESGGVTSVVASAEATWYTKDDGSVWGMGVNIKGESSNLEAIAYREPIRLYEGPAKQIINSSEHLVILTVDGRPLVYNLGSELVEPEFEGYATRTFELLLPATNGLLLAVDDEGWLWGANVSRSRMTVGLRILGNRWSQLSFLGSEILSGANDDELTVVINDQGRLAGVGTDHLHDGYKGAKESSMEVIFGSSVEDVAAFGRDLVFLLSDGSLWGMSSSRTDYWEDTVYLGGRMGFPSQLTVGKGLEENQPPVIEIKRPEKYLNITGDDTFYGAFEGQYSTDDRYIAKWRWSIGEWYTDERNAIVPLVNGRNEITLTVTDSDGAVSTETFAIRVDPAPAITSINTGLSGSFVILDNGEVYGAGSGPYEEFGIPSHFSRNWNGGRVDLPPMKTLKVGERSLLGVAKDQSVWVAGVNEDGQLGLGWKSIYEPPTRIEGFSVERFATGTDCNFIVTSTGELWAAGSNELGQLGLGELRSVENWTKVFDSGVSSVSSDGSSTLVCLQDGSVIVMGSDYSRTISEMGPEPALLVSSGVRDVVVQDQMHFLIKDDGSLWGAGRLNGGSLGLGEGWFTERFELIDQGNVLELQSELDRTLYLKADGSLWGMGLNRAGEFGQGIDRAYFPVEIFKRGVADFSLENLFALVLRDDGACFGVGRGDRYQLTTYPTLGANDGWNMIRDGDGSWVPSGPIADSGGGVTHYITDDRLKVVFDGRASRDDWWISSWKWTIDENVYFGPQVELDLPRGMVKARLEVTDIEGNVAEEALQVGIEHLDDFEQWISSYFSREYLDGFSNLLDADFDDDGLPNRLEKRLSLDPADPTSKAQLFLVEGPGGPEIRLVGVKEEGLVRIMESVDLQDWHPSLLKFEWVGEREAVATIDASVSRFYRIEMR